MRHSTIAHLGFFPVKRPYRGVQESIRRIRVVLAHGQVLFRDGLVRVLDRENDIQVVGQAASGEEAADHCRRLAPDVLVTDVALPPMGLEGLLPLLDARRPRILLLPFSREGKIEESLSGWVDAILANGDSAELARHIRVLCPGERSSPRPYSWAWTK